MKSILPIVAHSSLLALSSQAALVQIEIEDNFVDSRFFDPANLFTNITPDQRSDFDLTRVRQVFMAEEQMNPNFEEPGEPFFVFVTTQGMELFIDGGEVSALEVSIGPFNESINAVTVPGRTPVRNTDDSQVDLFGGATITIMDPAIRGGLPTEGFLEIEVSNNTFFDESSISISRLIFDDNSQFLPRGDAFGIEDLIFAGFPTIGIASADGFTSLVPEPSTGLLASLSICFLIRRRR